MTIWLILYSLLITNLVMTYQLKKMYDAFNGLNYQIKCLTAEFIEENKSDEG